jgi:glycerol-3-phosphate acyltransferase PlsY
VSPAAATLLIVGSYLLGSLSPAYHLGRALGGVDLRRVGSGNLGARNAARELGTPVGLAVWALDAAKGAAAVLLARALSAPQWVVTAAGAASVTGHIWPPAFRFRGGRGASAALGASLALLPLEALIGFAVWAIVSRLSGSMYVGGIAGFPVAAASAFLFGRSGSTAVAPLVVALPVVLRHLPALARRVRARDLRLP